jgi:hypothetical protein
MRMVQIVISVVPTKNARHLVQELELVASRELQVRIASLKAMY